jgi:hypothetical protein
MHFHPLVLEAISNYPILNPKFMPGHNTLV